jgi:hypothetical protein
MRKSQSIIKKGAVILAAIGLNVLPLKTVFATDVTYNTWLDSIKFGGDLRLRHDTLFATSNGSNRDRDRFRFRYGFNAKSGDITAIFRMATSAGTSVNPPSGGNITTSASLNGGDGLSANQTEDSAFARRGLWVDLAEIRYTPLDMLTLRGGKMDNPFWNGWSSTDFWDPDLNPEGYVEELTLPLGTYATLGQFSINENSGFHDANPWMFVERIGLKQELPMDMRAHLSATDYGFTHEKMYPFNGDNKQGNTRATVGGNANVLTSAYNVLQLDGKLALHAIGQPLNLEAGFVRNTMEDRNKGQDGNIFGLTLGNASTAHTWEVAYYHKMLGANAVIADFVDDDFGYGGTNQGGHIFWVGYAPRDNVLLKASYYNTHILDQSLAGGSATHAPYISHLMLDIVVKI